MYLSFFFKYFTGKNTDYVIHRPEQKTFEVLLQSSFNVLCGVTYKNKAIHYPYFRPFVIFHKTKLSRNKRSPV